MDNSAVQRETTALLIQRVRRSWIIIRVEWYIFPLIR